MPNKKPKSLCPDYATYGMCLQKECNCLHLSIVQDARIGNLKGEQCPFAGKLKGCCPFGDKCRRSHACPYEGPGMPCFLTQCRYVHSASSRAPYR